MSTSPSPPCEGKIFKERTTFFGMGTKKGLSPIIATVLLISLGIILAVIIFLWAKGFITETPQKFGEPIEESCKQVVMTVEATTTEIRKKNDGTVGIYGIEVQQKKVDAGSLTSQGTFESTVGAGASIAIAVSDLENEGGKLTLGENDEVTVLPVLLVENSDRSERNRYTCPEQYGQTVTVGS